MESDFVTQQHLDSLVPNSDPNIAEVLNKYKFPPVTPQPRSSQMGNYGPYFGGAPSNNEIFLGAMLGQIQASVQNRTQKEETEGFQLKISNEVLKWVFVLLLVAALIWLVFYISRRERKPLKRRLKKLERSYKKLRKAKRKNPKSLSDSNDDFEALDTPDDLDDFDDDFDDD